MTTTVEVEEAKASLGNLLALALGGTLRKMANLSCDWYRLLSKRKSVLPD